MTATARKVAVLFYNAVRHGMEYVDPGASSYGACYRTRAVNNLHRRAKAFGFVLQPLEPKAGCRRFLGIVLQRQRLRLLGHCNDLHHRRPAACLRCRHRERKHRQEPRPSSLRFPRCDLIGVERRNCSASWCHSVRSPLMAASATPSALKAGVWFRRGRLFIVSPDSRGTACPLSGRNSNYRPVQISRGRLCRAPEDHSEHERTASADQQKPNRSSWHAHEKSRINDIGRWSAEADILSFAEDLFRLSLNHLRARGSPDQECRTQTSLCAWSHHVPYRAMRAMTVADLEDLDIIQVSRADVVAVQQLKRVFKTRPVSPSHLRSGHGRLGSSPNQHVIAGEKALAPRFGQFSHLLHRSCAAGRSRCRGQDEDGNRCLAERIEDALRADRASTRSRAC